MEEVQRELLSARFDHRDTGTNAQSRHCIVTQHDRCTLKLSDPPSPRPCRVTSPTRNSAPLGPYSRKMPKALWFQGGGRFLMGEVPLQSHSDLLLRKGCPQTALVSPKWILSPCPGSFLISMHQTPNPFSCVCTTTPTPQFGGCAPALSSCKENVRRGRAPAELLQG